VSATRGEKTFFERLENDERAALLALGRHKAFPKDSILMFQDDTDERLMLLLSGRVKVTRSAEGEQSQPGYRRAHYPGSVSATRRPDREGRVAET
jgi:hypothetical protein